MPIAIRTADPPAGCPRGSDRRQILALCVVMLLTVSGLFIVGESVLRQAVRQRKIDARIINLAGRQRMLSQRLAKSALATALLPNRAARLSYASELRATARRLERVHHRLRGGERTGGGLSEASRTIQRHLAELDGDVGRLVGAARALLVVIDRDELPYAPVERILSAEGAVVRGMDRVVHGLTVGNEVLATEPRFLDGMDRVVRRYEREARSHVEGLADRQMAFLVVVLGAVVLFVFSPAVHALRGAIADEARLRQELLDVSLSEQRRIGQDLHDGLGQQLAGISLMTQVLAQTLRRRGADDEVEAATRIEELVRDAVRETRNLALALSPVELERGDIGSALRALAAYAASVFDVECVVRGEERGGGIDPSTAQHLYRIAQEAVTNAVRHGGARRVVIELGGSGGERSLSVSDDGHGFAVGARSSGMGLHIMRQRALAVRGVLEVQSALGVGTTVRSSFRTAEVRAA